MYKWFLTAAAVCLLGVSAVAVAEDSYYLELPTKGVTSSRKISVDVPGENPVEDGVNPLTGESWYGNLLSDSGQYRRASGSPAALGRGLRRHFL